MLKVCFPASDIDAFNKVSEIVKRADCLLILKLDLKAATTCLKLGLICSNRKVIINLYQNSKWPKTQPF